MVSARETSGIKFWQT